MLSVSSRPKALLYYQVSKEHPSVLCLLHMVFANSEIGETLVNYFKTAASTGILKGRTGQDIKDVTHITVYSPSQDEHIFYEGLGFRRESGQLMVRLATQAQEGLLAVLAKGSV